jgi:hypothetical protein
MDYPYHEEVDKTTTEQAEARLPDISFYILRFYLQIKLDKFVHNNNDKVIANRANLLKRVVQ